MTFEQRLAELRVDPAIILLNGDRFEALYERFYKASEATAQKIGIGFSALTMITLLLREIAERDDIIDRMETRIVNLTGERDYLEKRFSAVDCDCDVCVFADNDADEPPCLNCGIPEKHFGFAGIPDDWRADDGAESDT